MMKKLSNKELLIADLRNGTNDNNGGVIADDI